MGNKFKIILSFLILSVVLNCYGQKKVLLSKINNPTIESFDRKLKKENLLNESIDKNFLKIIKEENESLLERRLNARNKIIDSLNINVKSSFYIIDKNSHDSNGEYEETYIFINDNDIIHYRQPRFQSNKMIIEKITKNDFVKSDKETLVILLNIEKVTSLDKIGIIKYSQPISSYYVTKVINGNVLFFETVSTDFIVRKY